MHIATLFTVANVWKQPRCASADGWTEKMWGGGVRVCNGILALIKKIPPFAKKWTDLEDIMLN